MFDIQIKTFYLIFEKIAQFLNIDSSGFGFKKSESSAGHKITKGNYYFRSFAIIF